MASSLKELIEEWELERDYRNPQFRREKIERNMLDQCISDLRDTLLVMEAEEVRKGIFSVSCSNGHILP